MSAAIQHWAVSLKGITTDTNCLPRVQCVILLTTLKCHHQNKENGKPWYYQPELPWLIRPSHLCVFFPPFLLHTKCRIQNRKENTERSQNTKLLEHYGFSLGFSFSAKTVFPCWKVTQFFWRNDRLTIHTINLVRHTVYVWKCLINNNINNNILTKVFLLISDLGQFVFPEFVGCVTWSECYVL